VPGNSIGPRYCAFIGIYRPSRSMPDSERWMAGAMLAFGKFTGLRKQDR
jgi:hypothetical protein